MFGLASRWQGAVHGGTPEAWVGSSPSTPAVSSTGGSCHREVVVDFQKYLDWHFLTTNRLEHLFCFFGFWS